MKTLKAFTKTLPLFFTALVLAIAVWIMAVTSADPSIEKAYPETIPVEIIGQSTNLVITTEIPESIDLVLRAPSSIWESLTAQKVPVRALIDLSGLGEGSHVVPVQIQIGIKPVEVRDFSPQSITLAMEPLKTIQTGIRLIAQGSLAVGYQSNPAQLSDTLVMVSGASSNVDKVAEVRAVVRLTDAKTDINQTITLQPVDANGTLVRDVTLSPDKVTVTQKVFERGGYRNVVVKIVTIGQVANGYRLSGVSVFPPTVTVFATDPALVDALPGYVETLPIDLSRKAEGFEEEVKLNLPLGVQVIGDLSVLVKVEINAIQDSLPLSNVKVEAHGLSAQYSVAIQPETVDVIVSGPLTALQALNQSTLRILLDLTGYTPGTYTIEPEASLNVPDVSIGSISPTTFVITIR